MLLKDKVAVITGAGRGIGRYFADGFFREGASLAVISRTEKELQEMVRTLRAKYSPGEYENKIISVAGDISDIKTADNLIEMAVSEFGKIDFLINNAGIYGPIGELTEINPEEWEKTIRINLLGTVYPTIAALKKMRKQKEGRIINMSGGGTGGKNITERISAYTTSKAAVVAFTEVAAKENKKYNITINAIAPGAVNTKLLDEVLAAGERAGEDFRKRSQKQKETGGDSPELALKLAFFLCSERAAGITGKMLSAKWDDYEKLPERLKELGDSSLCNLRRIDGVFFGEQK